MGKYEGVYIVRCGETALKGKNKPYFERALARRIRRVLKDLSSCRVQRVDGLLFIRMPDDVPQDQVLQRVGRVFGVESISPAWEIDIQDLPHGTAMDAVSRAAVEWMSRTPAQAEGAKTFKIIAKRADKEFSILSPAIASSVGGYVLRHCGGLRVDVHDPDK